MFWTNWNEQAPSIMRASLNGANVLVIIGSDIKTPNGLAIDHRAEKLYFSDATLDKIERCEYDGSSRYVSETTPPLPASFSYDSTPDAQLCLLSLFSPRSRSC